MWYCKAVDDRVWVVGVIISNHHRCHHLSPSVWIRDEMACDSDGVFLRVTGYSCTLWHSILSFLSVVGAYNYLKKGVELIVNAGTVAASPKDFKILVHCWVNYDLIQYDFWGGNSQIIIIFFSFQLVCFLCTWDSLLCNLTRRWRRYFLSLTLGSLGSKQYACLGLSISPSVCPTPSVLSNRQPVALGWHAK